MADIPETNEPIQTAEHDFTPTGNMRESTASRVLVKKLESSADRSKSDLSSLNGVEPTKSLTMFRETSRMHPQYLPQTNNIESLLSV